MAPAAARAGERLSFRAARGRRRDVTVGVSRITYNILMMTKGSAHYAKAGQKTLAAVPQAPASIEIEFAGRIIRGVVAQVYRPPGCDGHCLGTLFVREA